MSVEIKIKKLIEEVIGGSRSDPQMALKGQTYDNPLYSNDKMNKDVDGILDQFEGVEKVGNRTILFKNLGQNYSPGGASFRPNHSEYTGMSKADGLIKTLKHDLYSGGDINLNSGTKLVPSMVGPYLPGNPLADNHIVKATDALVSNAHEGFEALDGKRKDIEFLKDYENENPSTLYNRLFNNEYITDKLNQSNAANLMQLTRFGRTNVSNHNGPAVLVNEFNLKNRWLNDYGHVPEIKEGLIGTNTGNFRNVSGEREYIKELTGMDPDDINDNNVAMGRFLANKNFDPNNQYYSSSPEEKIANDSDKLFDNFMKVEQRNLEDPERNKLRDAWLKASDQKEENIDTIDAQKSDFKNNLWNDKEYPEDQEYSINSLADSIKDMY